MMVFDANKKGKMIFAFDISLFEISKLSE